MATTNEKKLDTISSLLKGLCDTYLPRLQDDEEIAAGLQRLWRRSLEYRHGSFIMLVVGPVKSGKSTLVNLLAHRYVSPTDKLECTLRPTIISSVEADAQPAIEIYSSKDETRKEKDLDLIIDKLRGIIDDDSELREHLTRETYPLSDENIETYIAPSYNRQDNSIITAITTPGSKMLRGSDAGKIFLADMPGFDGNRINLSSSLYDAMSRRVDLILFVHSSVSAFNVTSNEYLDKLREYNGSVPVYLVHNIFDACWWQSPEERRAEVERQSKSEYEEIKHKGFNIEPDYVSCLNLGMVTDYLKGGAQHPGSEEALEQAWRDFEAVEDRLYDKITSRIGDQRLERCLERTDKLRDDLVKKIWDRTQQLDAGRRDRNALQQHLEGLDKALSLTQNDYDTIIGNISEDADRSLFKTLAKSMVNKSMSNKESLALLKEILASFLFDVDEKLTSRLYRHFSDKLRDSQEELDAHLGTPAGTLPPLEEVRAHSEQNIPEDKVKRFMRPSLFPLKPEAIRASVSNMEQYFYGDPENRTIQNLKRLLTAEISRMEGQYLDQIRSRFESCLQQRSDPGQDRLLDTLESLLKRLKDIII
ncbi:MAG: dynamin family protein [Bacteroidales bacterium]|nr:dynamin family protein [Bacteroidales bacterium]